MKPIASGSEPRWQRYLPLLVAVLYVVTRLPFLSRYDLWFGSDVAVLSLQAQRILHGEIPLYFWGQDYFGTLPQFVLALLFRVFGFSLKLAAFFNTLIWALGVAVAVAYVRKAMGAQAAVYAGLALVVSVPRYLQYEIPFFGATYNMTVLIVFGFLWLGIDLLESPSAWKMLKTGLLFGFCLYLNKQVAVPVVTLALVALLCRENRARLKRAMAPRFVAVFVAALGVGYLPELAFKVSGAGKDLRPRERVEAVYQSKQLVGLASPSLAMQNAYWLARALPAYFDGDPYWRGPVGLHYLEKLENEESFPRGIEDVVGIVVAFFVVSFMGRQCRRAYRRKDNWLLALAVLPIVNAGLVIGSKVTDANYHNAIRYIFPSGAVLLVWTGALLHHAICRKHWFLTAFLGCFLLQSLSHRWQMLRLPDELRDLRQVVAELKANNLRFGATFYSYAHTMTALSAEEVVFASVDRHSYSAYLHQVMSQPVIALVYPTFQPSVPLYVQKLIFGDRRLAPQKFEGIGSTVQILGATYSREGQPHVCGEFTWCRFRKEAPDRNQSR